MTVIMAMATIIIKSISNGESTMPAIAMKTFAVCNGGMKATGMINVSKAAGPAAITTIPVTAVIVTVVTIMVVITTVVAITTREALMETPIPAAPAVTETAATAVQAPGAATVVMAHRAEAAPAAIVDINRI